MATIPTRPLASPNCLTRSTAHHARTCSVAYLSRITKSTPGSAFRDRDLFLWCFAGVMQRFRQYSCIADVIGEQQDQPGIDGRALVR